MNPLLLGWLVGVGLSCHNCTSLPLLEHFLFIIFLLRKLQLLHRQVLWNYYQLYKHFNEKALSFAYHDYLVHYLVYILISHILLIFLSFRVSWRAVGSCRDEGQRRVPGPLQEPGPGLRRQVRPRSQSHQVVKYNTYSCEIDKKNQLFFLS